MDASGTQPTTIKEHLSRNRRGLAVAIALFFGSVMLGTVVPYFLIFGGHFVEPLRPVLDLFAIQTPGLYMLLFPVGMAGVAVVCLLIEAYGLGYRNSTLSLVIEGSNASVRNDMFYFFLRVTGTASLLMLIMTLGASAHVLAMTEMGLERGVIKDINPALQFVVLVLVLTFCNYWTHRALHSKWLFELHKVHHSAEHMGVLLPFRAHPLDHYVAKVYTAGSLALLGVDLSVLMAWMGLNAIYQSMVHCKLDWPAWTAWIVVTPALHRIHHSTAPEHYNKNLSILTIWDRLFGTYHPPAPVPGYGVDAVDRENFNTDRYFSEVFLCFLRWLGLGRRETS